MRRLAASLALAVVIVLGAGVAHADYPQDCIGSQDKFQLTNGNDTRHYSTANKCVDALGGTDFIYLDSGDNTVWGDGGPDDLFGSPGRDILSGNEAGDLLIGYAESDVLKGNDGDDRIYDGKNPAGFGDVIYGGTGNDILFHCTGAGSNGSDDFIDPSIETVVTGSQQCDGA